MFILSWCFIIKALRQKIVPWPGSLPNQPPSLSIYLVCVFLGMSLIRLYIELWRVEEDRDIVMRLCPPDQKWPGMIISSLEFIIRIIALALMYLLTIKLSTPGVFIVQDAQSDFCWLFIGVFVAFLVWDFVAIPRLIWKAEKIDKCFFVFMTVTDFLSLSAAILYRRLLLAGNQDWAEKIMMIFGGFVLLFFIFEMIFTGGKICQLAREKFLSEFPKK